jgi:hypothetical protein
MERVAHQEDLEQQLTKAVQVEVLRLLPVAHSGSTNWVAAKTSPGSSSDLEAGGLKDTITKSVTKSDQPVAINVPAVR